MRTFKLTQILTTIVAVFALSMAVLTAGASAHSHHHHRRHHHHNRHHHRHARRHARHHRDHLGSAPTPAAATGSFAAPSLAAIALIQPTPVGTPAITGTTYYVSPTGADTNSGTSPGQAWQTVLQVNRATSNGTIKPGDAVLFQGGATFSDAVLEPGWGNALSGTSAQPIVFGSFGSGRAALPGGVWLHDSNDLVITDLDLGPKQGVSGTGNNITVENCSIHDIMPGQAAAEEEAINAVGSNWVIAGNSIQHTGDSGMLIRGDQFRITGNVIGNTGLDQSLNYGEHGIYLKATNSTVSGNVIYNFRDDGVSVRYRNSVVSNNLIANGQIGIAWFQYDPTAGTSQWTSNTIIDDAVVGIYVSPSDPTGGNTRESFVIQGNHVSRSGQPASDWQAMNLTPTSGTYTVSGNEQA